MWTAPTWIRSLLLMARAEATGAMVFESHGRSARLEFTRGLATAFEGDLGPRLGEFVARPSERTSSWGAQSVAEGKTPRNELAWALRRQMRLRVRELARWSDVKATWHPDGVSARPFTEAMSVCDLVAEALRALPTPPPNAAPGTLDELGRWWASRAALHPVEIHALHASTGDWMTRAASAGLCTKAMSEDERGLVRAAQTFRQRGAAGLTPAIADVTARRRAMRDLVARLHPDRFDGDPALSTLSTELVSRLTSASR